MDRNIYGKNLHELEVAALAELCANVAMNHSADPTQTDTAHAFRVKWIRLGIDRSLDGDKTEAEASLKTRMFDFYWGYLLGC
jgi:hypothetical protein